MRLIDADAYIYSNDLKNEPTIEAEPVVYCGKCANHKDFIDNESHCRCLLLRQTVNKNDYCSFGEMKK